MSRLEKETNIIKVLRDLRFSKVAIKTLLSEKQRKAIKMESRRTSLDEKTEIENLSDTEIDSDASDFDPKSNKVESVAEAQFVVGA